MAQPRSPKPVAAEATAASEASRVRGTAAFGKTSENKQLKMAATTAASPALHRHRPERSAAAHLAGLHHLRRNRGGEGTGGGEVFMVIKKTGKESRKRTYETLLKE